MEKKHVIRYNALVMKFIKKREISKPPVERTFRDLYF